ncbi:diguanylate cyclase (GGDEF) domain-containing protein [Burkholderia sp. Ch1-1]|uniref:diguanylate cyclase n=1 Tax=Paraburkholderia dioscoreae TaxID=2604047 RepID=A0A5Q4ZBQ2_9BURK|nr:MULTISPECIES: GGDEF domain-containing protein [Paraburkholderia]EIF33529.1 diguanylate cyclase (GGDEF) domain-containing protein [Burkholderia sp. Ch1-1]MDR8395700.1 GGDEF domain-containing protein [Paraburkholderia sp. USG1]VVD32389.1 Diguanylate cyclase (GGDEF) domain-containing protein [Paraburkholderia dioscoreae]
MFNPLSILLVTVLSSVMAIAVLGSLWRAAIPGVGYWVSANAVAIVALLAFSLQGHASQWLTFVASNVLMAASLLLVVEGCLRFLGRRARPWPAYVGLVAVLVGISYWTFAAPDFNARVALVSAFHASLYVVLAVLMLRGRPSNRPRYSYYFLAVAALLLFAGNTSRGLMYGFGWLMQTGLLQVSPSNVIFLALGILAPLCLSIGVVMLAHDRLAERLERLANIDDLTGALSRRAFLAAGDVLLNASRQTRSPLTMAIIDIDSFKAVNDNYGHAAGDQVLSHFATFVARNLRTGDVFGRLGGEEFGVLCPATTTAEAVSLLDRLRIRLASTAPNGLPRGLRYTFSVGVDQLRRDESLAQLMARADGALYVAKASGRNRVMAA